MLEKICRNCVHWMCDAHGGAYLIHYVNEQGKETNGYFSPCAIHAVEPDAGDSIALMAKDGHCICHSDAFKPSAYYLEELAEQGIEFDEAAYNGVTPGSDFPGSLYRGL